MLPTCSAHLIYRVSEKDVTTYMRLACVYFFIKKYFIQKSKCSVGIVRTTVVMRSLRSLMLRGFVAYTRSLTIPHNKKSHGVKYCIIVK
jgi:hypothetical protein